MRVLGACAAGKGTRTDPCNRRPYCLDRGVGWIRQSKPFQLAVPGTLRRGPDGLSQADDLGTDGRTVRIGDQHPRSEEHTSELQSLMRISYAVFCLHKNTPTTAKNITTIQ